MVGNPVRSGGSVVVIDAVKLSTDGHHLTSLKVLSQALHPRPVTIHLSRGSQKGLAEPFANVAYSLKENGYHIKAVRETIAGHTIASNLKALRYLITGRMPKTNGLCFAPDFERLLDNMSKTDHLVVPTALPDVLASLLFVARTRDLDQLPHIHFRVLEIPTPPTSELMGNYLAGWSALCRQHDRIFAYSESQTIADYLVKELKYPKIRRAILQSIPPRTTQPARTTGNSKELRIGYVGASLRDDKGAGELFNMAEQILDQIAEKTPDLKPKLVIQIPARPKRKHIESIKRLGGFKNRVELVQGPLNEADFGDMIAGLDVMLLPYPESRRVTLLGSGLVMDAAMRGVPIVATNLPALAEFVGDAGILVDDPNGFPTAVATVAENLSSFQKHAATNAHRILELAEDNDMVSAILAA